MSRHKTRPRLRTRNPKIRCYAEGCQVLAERFVDKPLQPREWYCKFHLDEKEKLERGSR
jgi:hypothetical protein